MSERLAFVTGATGFIGFHIARLLAAEGWHTVALHRPSADTRLLEALHVELVTGDLANRASILSSVPEGTDAIFHVAGNVSFEAAGDTAQNADNILGTENIVAAALERNCARFIYTSTGATFGLHDGWVTEETPSNATDIPINYFRTKTLAEDAVRAACAGGLDAVILNPANVVGPYDRSIWTPFVLAVAAGAIPGIGPGAGSFCHIDEVARAHLAAFHRGGRGERYLLAGAVAKFADVGNLVARLTGGTAPPVVDTAPPGVSPETFELMSRVQEIDCTKACRELGFKPVTIETMFTDLVDWLQAEGRLPA